MFTKEEGLYNLHICNLHLLSTNVHLLFRTFNPGSPCTLNFIFAFSLAEKNPKFIYENKGNDISITSCEHNVFFPIIQYLTAMTKGKLKTISKLWGVLKPTGFFELERHKFRAEIRWAFGGVCVTEKRRDSISFLTQRPEEKKMYSSNYIITKI